MASRCREPQGGHCDRQLRPPGPSRYWSWSSACCGGSPGVSVGKILSAKLQITNAASSIRTAPVANRKPILCSQCYQPKSTSTVIVPGTIIWKPLSPDVFTKIGSSRSSSRSSTSNTRRSREIPLRVVLFQIGHTGPQASTYWRRTVLPVSRLRTQREIFSL